MISLHQVQCQLRKDYTLSIDSLIIEQGEHTVVLGANGSGKSALAALLAGEGRCTGQVKLNNHCAWVSVAQQQAVIEQERKKDSADILDIVPTPSTVKEVILGEKSEPSALSALAQGFGIAHLLTKPFLSLSTGETRKALLIQAILSEPEVLILDEPWDGLDTQAIAHLDSVLESLSHHVTLVLIINRLSEIPVYSQKLVYMDAGTIGWQSEHRQVATADIEHIRQLAHIHDAVHTLPPRDKERSAPELAANMPIAVLNNGHVQYDERVIFTALSWQINKAEHWQVVGPNGSGKTCLLSMLTGDNPHCYTNDLTIFGYKRGSGESIWDIKQHIGIVSSALHLQYRVNCSLSQVILSGFYDSIGLYQQPSDVQKHLARQWIDVMALGKHMDTPFQSLSFGDQRLALIARAMVKHPSLLILDEPCNGLDELNRLKVLAMVNLLAQQGETTILYVNHHAEDKIEAIQQVLDMRDYQPKPGI